MFDKIIELFSILGKGFLMNDIIRLLNNDLYISINEEQLNTLKQALNYIELIKKGKDIIVSKNIIGDIDLALEIFNITLNALSHSEKNITIKEFDQIIGMSEEQIKNSIESKKIIEENKEISLKLFESIRKQLYKEAEKINIM